MPKGIEKRPSVLLHTAFIGCGIALAILAWLPATIMMRTVLGGHAEHFVAYSGTAILMGLTFQKSPRLTVQCVLLIVYAAVLEAGQFFFSARSASFSNFAFIVARGVTGGFF